MQTTLLYISSLAILNSFFLIDDNKLVTGKSKTHRYFALVFAFIFILNVIYHIYIGDIDNILIYGLGLAIIGVIPNILLFLLDVYQEYNPEAKMYSVIVSLVMIGLSVILLV